MTSNFQVQPLKPGKMNWSMSGEKDFARLAASGTSNFTLLLIVKDLYYFVWSETPKVQRNSFFWKENQKEELLDCEGLHGENLHVGHLEAS